MPYHSLVNNDEKGEVDVFEAVDLTCAVCGGATIRRKTDDYDDDAYHKSGCAYDYPERYCPMKIVDLGWYYAFGSPGYRWEDDEPTGPYNSEKMALDAAQECVLDRISHSGHSVN